MTITEKDLVIKELDESCDECDDDPIILGAIYKDKVVYSCCLHEESDRDNVTEDLIDNALCELNGSG